MGVYKGSRLNEISFPLGGIGTGCIGLSGNGRLIDWEIFNRPNKGTTNGFSHFSVKVESDGKVLDARILNGDLNPPYTGSLNMPHFESFGYGPHRTTLAGMPHFKEVEFIGEYPVAELKFGDDKFPGKVSLRAFNPFIPLNDKDSSIPAAFFEIDFENVLNKAVNFTAALSFNNPLNQKGAFNKYANGGSYHTIEFGNTIISKNELNYGNLCIATDAVNVSYQEYWYRGRWFDSLVTYWKDFTSARKLKNRFCTNTQEGIKHYPGSSDTSTLVVHEDLMPGEKRTVRFVITWNFPNCYNYWNPEQCDGGQCACNQTESAMWKNYYATQFFDAKESAVYCLNQWDRLKRDTLLFKNALFSSTIPQDALDAISANISILKTPTCLRLEDGSFYGFEGCHCDSGCCEGSCTHVWNYAYALPFLFPVLERSMRDLDFKYNQRGDGGMAFRLQLPLERERTQYRPCADGQFGGVIKAYRDWKISGDSAWLKRNWEAIKKSIEFAWDSTNEDLWDRDKDGVLEGRQHHTLDMELFGPNSWLTGMYLAALKAGAEMAEYLGENKDAKEYVRLFSKGKKWVEKNLFNGEYYCQKINLKDKALLGRFDKGLSLLGDHIMEVYWNEEAEEIKYQIGEGCIIDQVIAQWHANLCGLGEIFDKNQVKKALQSIYKYNFKKSMRDVFNPCRIYSLNDEAGVIICEWPEGKQVPAVPVPYAEETMNGFEYQAAVLMIQEGLHEEGMEIIRAIRSRFDGKKRNPWNEFECGSNYARSMASYALLLAFSGFEYDMVNNSIGFDPVTIKNKEFRCFWSLDSGWGIFEMKDFNISLRVLYGVLTLKEIKLPFLSKNEVDNVLINDRQIGCSFDNGILEFNSKIRIGKDNVFKILLCINKNQ